MKERSIGIIGKSKTGKTRNILFNEMREEIKNNNSLLIYDETLEYYNNFSEELKSDGYKVEVVNFKDSLHSNGWNPLEYIYNLYVNGRVDKAIELIQNMGSELFKSNDTDPYWSNAASDYFTGIVLILLKIAKEEGDMSAINFYSTLMAMNDSEDKYKDSNYLKEYLRNIDSMDPIYISLSPVVFAPVETRGSILSVVRQRLNLYFSRPGLVKFFASGDFKISDISSDEKVVVFVVGYKPYNTLTNILLEQMCDVVDNDNKKMTFIIDGLDSLDEIKFIDEIIEMSNRDKMRFISTVRSKDILKEKYNSIMPFDNIEKVITLENTIDSIYEDKKYPLPELQDKEIERFDFKKYVK